MADSTPKEDSGTVKPTPDPTVLTTDALRREIKASTELTDSKLKALIDALESEKIHIAQIGALRDELAKEKFKNVETQFALRDSATNKLDIAGKTALAAALAAQKEEARLTNSFMTLLVDKMDTSFTKSVDSITRLISSNTETLTAIINDLKERQTRGEGKGTGLKEGWGYLVGIIGVAIGIIAALGGFK